jgi:hypothetical protein
MINQSGLFNRFYAWLKSHFRIINRVIWITGFCLLVVVIGYQVAINWQAISRYSWHWQYQYILFGFVSYSISLFLTAWIWSLIINRFSGNHCTIPNIALYSLTNIAQRLPTPIPYVSARVETYASLGISRAYTLSAMSVEMSITIISALIIGVFTLPFGIKGIYSNIHIEIVIIIAIILLLIAMYILNINKVIAIINRLLIKYNKSPISGSIDKKELVLWIGLYLLVWLNAGIFNLILANAIYPLPLHLILPMENIIAVSGFVGWIGQLLFFIPNIALPQIVSAYLLSSFVPWPVAITVSIIGRLGSTAFEVIWVGIFGILSRNKMINLNNIKQTR